jgi:hypothetical protein
VLRNWLACGAPVVAETKVPSWAMPPSDAGVAGADWGELYATVIKPSCAIAGCHSVTSAANGGLALADECAAHAALLEASSCGEPRVEPGNGDSLLLNKLESDRPRCGTLRMPPGQPLSAEVIASFRAWIEAGATADCD